MDGATATKNRSPGSAGQPPLPNRQSAILPCGISQAGRPSAVAHLFHRAGNRQSSIPLVYQPWPKHDPQWLVEDTVEIVLQVNGKVRDRITVRADAGEEEVKAAALASDKVKPFLEGKTIKKVILVPKKLVNIAVA